MSEFDRSVLVPLLIGELTAMGHMGLFYTLVLGVIYGFWCGEIRVERKT